LVYNSGAIQIFNVSRIENGSCMPVREGIGRAHQGQQ
jgi:hypothetical protein